MAASRKHLITTEQFHWHGICLDLQINSRVFEDLESRHNLGRHGLPLVVAVALLAACQSEPGAGQAASKSSLLTADTLGEQVVRSNEEYRASEEYATTDAAWGERLAMQCRACHSLEAGGNNMIGPALHGFFGKKAGSASGFSYSPVLAEAEFTWTPRALDAWLAQPAGFLPGNRMTFAGIQKADDRRAVIAYLLAATDDRP